MKKLKLYLIFVFVLIAISAIIGFNKSAQAQVFVPVPNTQVSISVEEGKLYRFPWIENTDCSTLAVGCFKVINTDKDRTIIEHPAFESADSLESYGWNLFTTIDKEGMWYKLYKFGKGSNEEWVYAVHKDDGLIFLKLPGSSTGKAAIYRFINVDFDDKRMVEKYVVESEEPITMFAADIRKLIPESSLTSIKVNDELVKFTYDKIMNLNLPAGKNTITVELSLRQPDTLDLFPIYEPRNMSLPKEINVQVKGGSAFELELTTIGIPEEVWENSSILLFSDPKPISVVEYPLLKQLSFDQETVTIKTKATIQYGGWSYPVIMRIK